MSAAVWLIELGRTSWRLFVEREGEYAQIAVQEFAPSELSLQADAIRAVLVDNGYLRDAVVLALESELCLSANIPIDRSSELRGEQSMAFRFEEWIPWGAEDFVADFGVAGNHALAIAVRTERLTAFLDRLAELDIHVERIVPWALLIAAAHVVHGVPVDSHVIAIERDGWIDLLTIEGSRISTWKWLPADATNLVCELECRALETGGHPSIVGYRLSTALSSELSRFGYTIEAAPTDAASELASILALAAASRVVQGALDSPIDLKRGRFGRSRGHLALRRYVLGLQVAVATMLLTITVTLLFRGYRYDRQTEQVASQQAEVFQSVFPNAKVPIGIANRLKSELAKLKGLRGDNEGLPESVAVTTVLHRLLSALPTDRRFRFLEIRIEEGRLHLDGEVREHRDAETIAQRLRGEGFQVVPPKTQRLDGERVTLRISGQLTPDNNKIAKASQ
jgi:type II secretory pathway component PulL